MKLYPDSGVELNPFMSKNYDKVMNLGSVGLYKRFINQAVADMNIAPADNILDMGCGTGRNAMLMYQYLGEEGKITGLDISSEMEEQFLKKFSDKNHVKFVNKRIDIAFDLDEKFDKVFISFVIHGFPHDVRDAVIKNAFKHLKPGGEFIILDFAEFDMVSKLKNSRMIVGESLALKLRTLHPGDNVFIDVTPMILDDSGSLIACKDVGLQQQNIVDCK